MPPLASTFAAALFVAVQLGDPVGPPVPCVATCLNPTAARSAPIAPPAASGPVGVRPTAEGVAESLARWSAASRALRPPGRAAKIAFAYAHPELNGHRAAFVQACDGPIDAAELAAGMTWAVTTGPGEFITLRGEARDPLAARLLGPVEVVLDGDTFLPTSVRFDPPAGLRAEPAVVIALEHHPPEATEFARGVRVASAVDDRADAVIPADAVTAEADTPLPFPPPPAE